MSTVLVTGADGFIGSHLTEALLATGYKVRAFCLYNSNGSWGWLDSLPEATKGAIEVVLGDIRDPLCVREAMRGVDLVFHLAALIAIPYSYVAPASYVDTNIHGTLNVVQAARDLGVSRLIHTSTSETYGTAQFVPITEDHPQVGQSPYAASKIGADQIALSYWRSFETPLAVLRPFNTYGPRQSARAVIPSIITQIAFGKRQIKLGALSPTRDFNFVTECHLIRFHCKFQPRRSDTKEGRAQIKCASQNDKLYNCFHLSLLHGNDYCHRRSRLRWIYTCTQAITE